MIRRILRTSTSVRIAVLVCVLAQLLIVRELNAQAALTVPAGLPDWAFNIPDKIQPSAVRPEGIVRAPGSAREDEAAKIDYLQGWRATAELKDYVCCDPGKRRTLASLRDAVSRFNPKHAHRPLTALLVARKIATGSSLGPGRAAGHAPRRRGGQGCPL